MKQRITIIFVFVLFCGIVVGLLLAFGGVKTAESPLNLIEKENLQGDAQSVVSVPFIDSAEFLVESSISDDFVSSPFIDSAEFLVESFVSDTLPVIEKKILVKEVQQPIQKQEKTPVKKVRKHTPKQEEQKIEVSTFIFDEKYYPLTLKDAEEYARKCYLESKKLIDLDNPVRAKVVAEKGLSIFENASLYYLVAQCNAVEGKFTVATNQCKTALSRNDYWAFIDKVPTIRLLLACMRSTMVKYPSEALQRHIDSYQALLEGEG